MDKRRSLKRRELARDLPRMPPDADAETAQQQLVAFALAEIDRMITDLSVPVSHQHLGQREIASHL